VNRPRIGVTVSRRSGWRIFPLMALSIGLAGGAARRWQTGRVAPDLDEVDGVVIGGGDDISPDLYGGAVVTSARIDAARDKLERGIVIEAMRRGMPVLGICRGAQMLNVALGGSLHQDAYGTYTASSRVWTILPRKDVTILQRTHLSRVAGGGRIVVNALHHQAVARLGKGLRVAARDDGGMIQAVERRRDPFALGVQWHPEHLFYARRQRAIFLALVAASAARAESRDQVAAVKAAATEG
jgi:putative glutamine amidotransferase